MLFKVNSKTDVFKDNPELRAIPEFNVLNDKQMKFVILGYDYKSPLRQKPKEERLKLAALAAGYKVSPQHTQTLDMRARELAAGEHEKTNKAIVKYLEIQYDEDIESINAIQKQIDNIKTLANKQTDDVAELTKINNLLLSLPELRKSQRELAKNAGLESEFKIEEEQRNLSTIDKMYLEDEENV